MKISFVKRQDIIDELLDRYLDNGELTDELIQLLKDLSGFKAE